MGNVNITGNKGPIVVGDGNTTVDGDGNTTATGDGAINKPAEGNGKKSAHGGAKESSAWHNGLFFLVLIFVVLGLIVASLKLLPLNVAVLAILGALIIYPLIGGLLLKYDKKITGKDFLHLMGMSFDLGKVFGTEKSKDLKNDA